MIGYSEGFHDAAIAVINRAQIKFASHSERYSKIKHDRYLHSSLIDHALYSIDLESDFRVGFYERPLLKKTRQLFAGQYKTVFKQRRLSLTPTDFFSHHLSHAAGAFQTSSFERAACVVVDSIGEWDTASVWIAEMIDGFAEYKKVWCSLYPHSIGLWYSALTKWAGLKPLDEEYIFMGMAAFGKNTYEGEVSKLLSLNNHKGLKLSLEGNPEDIAKSAEVVLEKKLSNIFDIALKYSNNICYGGGVALNCVVNTKLQQKCNLWIMPNPGDAGASLGAALLLDRRKVSFSPYLGYNIDRKIDPRDVVETLLQKGICGIANGRAEFGPRALGNRSLLADPRTLEMKDRVNEIKQRQKFRPFAPVILEEHCQKYFDMPSSSPYMSFVYTCKRPEEIPACIHVDNSARVQTVSEDCPSIIRKILECWYVKTGCPVLLNTSLNIRGMPIANDWQDALDFSKTYSVDIF